MISTATSPESSTVSETGRVGMEAMVGPKGPPRDYRTPSRLAQAAAKDLGMQAVSVEQLMHGHSKIQDRFACLVRHAIDLGDDAVYTLLMGPLDAVLAGRRTAPPDEALDAAAVTDGEEDVDEAQYRRARREGRPTRDLARRLLRTSAADRRRSEERDRAIAAAEGLSL